MKKTITALMIVAGLASADNVDFGKNIQHIINDSGYTEGTSYELTLSFKNISTITADQKVLLTLNPEDSSIDGDTGYYLLSQQDWGSDFQRYFGIADNNADAKPTGAESPESPGEKYTFEYDAASDIKTLTCVSGQLPGTWMTRNNNGEGSQSRDMSGGLSLTLSYDAEEGDSILTLNYIGSTVTDKVIFTDTQFLLSDLALGIGDSAKYFGQVEVGGKVYSIPEPTTATLSLLALAGLAARRRRK